MKFNFNGFLLFGLLFIVLAQTNSNGQLFVNKDSLQQSLKVTRNHIFHLKSKIALAHYYLSHDNRVTKSLIDSIETIVIQRKYTGLQKELDLLKSTYYNRVYNKDSSIHYIKLSFKHFNTPQTIEDTKYLGWSYIQYGFYKKNILEDREGAINEFTTAYETLYEIKQNRLAALASTSLAFIYEDLQLFEDAYDQLNRSLKIYSKQTSDLALIYRHLGIISAETQEYEKALQYYTKALRIYGSNQLIRRAKIYQGIADVLSRQTKMELCFENQYRALNIFKTYKNYEKIVYSTYFLAKYLTKDRQQEEAIKKLYTIINNEQYKRYQPYYDLSKIFYARLIYAEGKKEEAKKLVLETSNTNKNAKVSMESFKFLAEIHKDLNQLDKAFRYQNLYLKQYDSLQLKQDSLRRSNLQITIKTQNRIKENELANKLQAENDQKVKEKNELKLLYQRIGIILVGVFIAALVWGNLSRKKLLETIQLTNSSLVSVSDNYEKLKKDFRTSGEVLTKNKIKVFSSRISKKLSDELSSPLANIKVSADHINEFSQSFLDLSNLLKNIDQDDQIALTKIASKIKDEKFSLSTREERKKIKELKNYMKQYSIHNYDEVLHYAKILFLIEETDDLRFIILHQNNLLILKYFEHMIDLQKISFQIRESENILNNRIKFLQNLDVEEVKDSWTSYELKQNLKKVIELIESFYVRPLTINMKIVQDISIIAKKQLLNSIWIIILKNAVESVPSEQHVYIQISLEKYKKGYLISFQDNGQGIPLALQPLVFNTSSQEGSKALGSGNSLGLARETLRAMGGDIWFETNTLQGTIFYIYFISRTTSFSLD